MHIGNVAVKQGGEAMHPLFDQFDVNLVSSGHSHNYERSYPLGYIHEGVD